MRSKKAKQILQVTSPTLYRYVKEGFIKATIDQNGYYNYDEDSVYEYAGYGNGRKTVIYARVSSNDQKNDLKNQIDTAVQWANNNGYQVDDIYSDIASGLEYDRKSFKQLMSDVVNHKIKTIIVTHKDRFSRVSFNMWNDMFKELDCKLVVINQPESNEKELFEDIISLLHCSSMKMSTSRRKRKIQIIEEDLKNDLVCD